MPTCAHLDTIAAVAPSDDGCHECLAIGGWCYPDELAFELDVPPGPSHS